MPRLRRVVKMGWSCTQEADNTLRKIQTLYMGNSNYWMYKGKNFFFEIGREQEDGSITGSVFQDISSDTCKKVGSIKIDPDGKIIRFPHINKRVV